MGLLRQQRQVDQQPLYFDPNEVIVVLGWHDVAQARLFAKSVSWRAALEQMGVVGVPEVRFLEAVA